ncbi:retrotransposon Gag like 3 [Homo sapiens]|uniref:Retrotransposon Gag-like protein 3 n=1 Tax=Homo sapiens TaxID=9606 RepID=RTL3_HUMAN|nr:retrotransposon Gag-like protein 3 [Homo sapiens]Q8N8U3.1 RecName: Full=Retrotransposon Gag-like protein 3; AltName: Full=Zinc finger CCHC domain-containing protein 5 [Homo sapiens]EAW98597.1 zinc finger, CCHC domain containing 5 [Homo sapiens]KAI4000314.1 retrotransposon Gag like 3 [Homo sapiens]BAC04719.1 unnamed protein product [Homo sapiens]|eukprot:NP_689907.1 retrotransposon Gag-like protein 3 [Homo sapiens]
MVEDLAASYIVLKLENEIRQAQVQWLMEENAALQAQIPELQKSQAAKEYDLLRKSSEAKEPQKLPEHMNPPAAWEAQKTPEFKEPQKPPEPQDLLPWEPPAAWELQEAPAAPESLAPPATRESQKPPMAHEIPTVLEGQGPANTQDATIAQEPKNSEPQDPPNIEKPQEAPEYQETAAQLEFLELPPPQEPLEPSNAQEFLELSAAQESLEGLIVVETSAASEFPQAPIGLEATDFPLQYTLTFSGDSQKLPEFLVQLYSYMRVRGHLYPTEAALVSFVGNCFSGRAGWWFQLLLDIQSPLLEQCESFIPVLQDTFDNPENMKDANQCIHQLCQGEGHVATHFHLIAQELNWDESTLWIQFQEGLASSIQDELSHTSPATNLSDLITQCISLEEKPDPNPLGKSSSAEGDGPESPPAENQPMQAAINCPHISEAEWVRWHKGRLCLYCGYPGHFARDCPVKPHQALQAGNIQACQ